MDSPATYCIEDCIEAVKFGAGMDAGEVLLGISRPMNGGEDEEQEVKKARVTGFYTHQDALEGLPPRLSQVRRMFRS